MTEAKSIGIVTIHGIDNFGSLLQAYATQEIIKKIGYRAEIIDYKYPNEYHLERAKLNSPYAQVKLTFLQRVQQHFYHKYYSRKVIQEKHKLFNEERKKLLNLSRIYSTKEDLCKVNPYYDIYVTGSDQVWNPRYLYEDTTFFLSFTNSKNKVAFSASFGSTEIDRLHQDIIRPLLAEYKSISTRESSGVSLVKEICGKDAVCTCDPTLLLSGKQWGEVFNDEPLIKGDYILCYILTYTANPYPYAYTFVKHIKKALGMKVIFIDESGLYWCDPRHKSFQIYGPRQIINLFKNASFIISSSFHGAAFSINLRKNFYSIFPKGVKDERQESLLKIVGAEDRLIRVGDPFPERESIPVKNWEEIETRLNRYVESSLDYLKESLALCQ